MNRGGSRVRRPERHEERPDAGNGPVILWQVADAGELAARIASVGVDVEPGPADAPSAVDPSGVAAPLGRGESWIVRLVGGTVVVRPASGGAARLAVHRGRVAGTADASADAEMAAGLEPSPPADRELRAALVAIGWATVDIERTAASAGAAVDLPAAVPSGSLAASLPSDVALGARAASLEGRGSPPVILLEPEREGRLAASLARFGEGPCVLYLRAITAGIRSAPDRDDGHPGRDLRPVSVGPFGPEYVVPGGAAWGPHVVVVAPGSARHPTVPSDRVPSHP